MPQIIWRHIGIEVPDDWEMLLFGRDPQSGRCTFADRYQHRLELTWRKVPGRPDFERMLSDYRAQLQQDAEAEDVEPARHGEWQGFLARVKGVLTSRFGRWIEGEGCLVELVFIWPERRDERLERGVLGTVREAPADREGRRLWRAFGMEMRPRGSLALQSCTVQPGSVKLTFGDAKDALQEESFERLGMVPEWLREPLQAWLRRRVPAGVTVRAAASERVEGRVVEVVRGDRPAAGPKRLLGRRVPYEARAWVEPAEGRLYCCTVSGDGCGCTDRLERAAGGGGGETGERSAGRARPSPIPSPPSPAEGSGDWRPMLRATPRRNAAATVEETAEGTLRIGVRIRRPGWLVPPLSWIIRFQERRHVRLDAVGTQIWRWCDGRRRVEDVIDEFAARHGFTFHEARVAVTGYLRLLVRRGVLAMEQ